MIVPKTKKEGRARGGAWNRVNSGLLIEGCIVK